MEYFLFRCSSRLFLLLGLVAISSRSGATASSEVERYEGGLKCHPHLTIVVPGEYLVGGGIRAFGYRFSEGYYRSVNNTHFSVCICKVTRCLRKCCPKGQYLYNRNCTSFGAEDMPLQPPVYDRNHQLLQNYDYTRFVLVYGNTCEYGWFVLEPDLALQDTFLLMEDGTLVLPYDSSEPYYTDQFCFEHLSEPFRVVQNTSTLRALICYPYPEKENGKISSLMPIGMIISIPFLLATFLVYSLPELRNVHGKNLMSHVGSLFVAYIVLVIVQIESTNLPLDVCIAFGYIIQYSFLASFFWLNVMCFDIWCAFSGVWALKGEKKSTDIKKYRIYSVYAWGIPAIISTITLVMQFAPGIPDSDYKPDIGEYRCFFTREECRLAYFYGPNAVILIADVVFFILTAFKILAVKKETVAVFRGRDSRRNREASKQRYALYLKLFLIMGVNWIMEIISWAVAEPKWIWYITDLANTLQGVLIFSFFVLNARAKSVLSHRLSSQTLKSFISRESTRHSSRKSVTFDRSPSAGGTRL
ncbi:UNVERIFIED_CONTAM: hypothetical protein PYX00_005433 [Menopon gallinae]|uniref:G-protein coupled receptors family 2 profile 2 domain-containing protein n=1 Tax=Menopon gallinae TaxID=328185 RepID=A0AAW2HRK9_9NEOP